MTAHNVINVLIASPRDIVIEQKIVQEVCLGLNESPLLNSMGISFKSSSWEQSVSSDDTINDIMDCITNEYDILVCIVHEHMFSSAEGEEPGSLERFLASYDLWKSIEKPHIMLYIKEGNELSQNNRIEALSEKILALKNVIKNEKMVYCDAFSAPYEFCESIFNHLEHWAKIITEKL